MGGAPGSDDWPFFPAAGPRIVGGDGAWLIADDGKRILDAAGGAIVANIGHGRVEVAEAIAKASAGPSYVVPTWRTPQREAMAARLRERWLPANLTHIMATTSGSDGVEAAIKIALQHFAAKGESARTKVVSRALSYHGTTIAMAGLSGHRARKRGLEGFLQTFPAAPTPHPLRSPLGRHHPDTGAHAVAETRAVFEAEGPERIAAFVMEPVVGASGGAIPPPAGYVAGIRALCDEFGILLIVDEVMTGFGRTGTKFAVEHWDLRADILVSGKGLSGGYAPICGVFADHAVAEPIRAAGMDVMFHTYGAHPAACAASDVVLDILERENLVERAGKLGERLTAALEANLGQHPHVAEIRGLGLLQAVELVKDRETLERFAPEDQVTTRVVANGLERGVFFYPGGTGAARDIIVFGPAFVATEGEIDQMAETLARSIGDVLC
jgi:adenosylmethionine-8-amino-7-oxononanoate aminotransferase